MQANQQLFVYHIHYTHYLFISLFMVHSQKAPKMGYMTRVLFFFYFPDYIWEKLNHGKEVEISVPGQPMSSDSSEQNWEGEWFNNIH